VNREIQVKKEKIESLTPQLDLRLLDAICYDKISFGDATSI
jgi:hypothetical protein